MVVDAGCNTTNELALMLTVRSGDSDAVQMAIEAALLQTGEAPVRGYSPPTVLQLRT